VFVDDLATAMRQATDAAGDGNVGIGGGADVIRQALDAGYVDELAISTAPVILGGGKRLFEGFGRDVDLEIRRVYQSRSLPTLLRVTTIGQPASGQPSVRFPRPVIAVRRVLDRRLRYTYPERSGYVYADGSIGKSAGRNTSCQSPCTIGSQSSMFLSRSSMLTSLHTAGTWSSASWMCP
jgi:hypothetical protein